MFPGATYDQGQNNYVDDYQSVPGNWSIHTERKRQFLAQVKEVTGSLKTTG
jgi:hypothetical protein